MAPVHYVRTPEKPFYVTDKFSHGACECLKNEKKKTENTKNLFDIVSIMPPYCSLFGRCEENSNKIRHSWFKILSRRSSSPALLSH